VHTCLLVNGVLITPYISPAREQVQAHKNVQGSPIRYWVCAKMTFFFHLARKEGLIMEGLKFIFEQRLIFVSQYNEIKVDYSS
jgi:hypothetical protein